MNKNITTIISQFNLGSELIDKMDIIDKTEILTDNKYDYLEYQQEKQGPSFDADREEIVWLTMRIAQLELIIEKLLMEKNK